MLKGSKLEDMGSLGMQVGLVGLWLGLVGIGAEALSRSGRAEPETIRKVVHIGVGNVILLAWILAIPTWLGVTASLVFSAIALLSYRLPIMPVINSVGRHSLGTFFYAVSFAVLIAWFWGIGKPEYAVIGILIMTWGDGLAALVGQRFGTHVFKVWGMQKSWEGTFAMWMASYLVSGGILLAAYGFTGQTGWVPLVIATVATGLEMISLWGIDNVTVPVGSAAIAYGLMHSF
jgi:phytol kinase